MPRVVLPLTWSLAILLLPCQHGGGQQPPSIGYMDPPGGEAGATVEVVLGGYDWTPDMQLFVHDRRIELESLGPPGPVLVPEPPYWFGAKARRSPFPLPREMPARLTIPADVPPGIVRWQAANANGATASGRFLVLAGSRGGASADEETPPARQLREASDSPQPLPSLPVVVAGQIERIEEVDRYRFTAEQSGPIQCAVTAQALGSGLNAVLEIRSPEGDLIADAADTTGSDLELTFPAEADQSYEIRIFDLDFRGDRSFVYWLSLQAAEPTRGAEPAEGFEGSGHLMLPADVTSVLDNPLGEDRYSVTGEKGELWSVEALAERIGSPLDVAVAIEDHEGNELARADDSADSTDAALEFMVPEDGDYQIVVSDVGGHGGRRDAVYRLTIDRAEPGFTLTVPERLSVPIGGKAQLQLTVTRSGGFASEIHVTLSDLPAGVSVPEELVLPVGESVLRVDLSATEDAAAIAALVRVSGEAQAGEQTLRRTAAPLLLATTITPPFAIDAEGKDDVTKWPRGSTFPAPVLIERDEGFDEEIVLEMAAQQGRHRQGIHGPEVTVAAGVERILYPVFLPEWLETTRTSRMVVNGVAQVADPQGNVRYSLSRQKTRMGFLPTGALLKLSAETAELRAGAGERIVVPLTISRSPQLAQPLVLELHPRHSAAGVFTAEPQRVAADQERIDFAVHWGPSAASAEEQRLTIRATALQHGMLPVVSETTVVVEPADDS